MVASLSDAQVELYSRQILLPELGGIGQKRLLGSRCLLVGRGIGLAVAASYLAGAGVGRLDLLGGSATDLDLGVSLGERSPDTCVRDEPPECLDDCDALLLVAGNAALLTGLPGRPRCGELRLDVAAGHGASLVVIPNAAAGCALCITAAPGGTTNAGEDGATHGAVAELAGALAALAICRWIAGLDAASAPSALHLDVSAPTWEPSRVERALPCPRGCRS